MGKASKENIPVQNPVEQQHNLDLENIPDQNDHDEPSRSSGWRCSCILFSLFTLRCVAVLVLSLAILLPVIFWLFPHRGSSSASAAAGEKGNLNASVQAYFRLHKPVSEVMSQKERLEHEIFQTIGLPDIKVTVLSLNQIVESNSNYTDVKFAVLPVLPDHAISNHSLKILRSSFVKLFTKRLKLNLTTSSFGEAIYFEVVKFPGGITVDLLGSKPHFGVVLEAKCTFTLRHVSIFDIQYVLDELYGNLTQEMSLEPYESFYLRFKNDQGSTLSPPVTVQSYVFSTTRDQVEQRLDHFSRIVQTSPARNLGLDNSVFGLVKIITCSLYLDGNFIDPASALAPAPAPPPSSCGSSLC